MGGAYASVAEGRERELTAAGGEELAMDGLWTSEKANGSEALRLLRL